MKVRLGFPGLGDDVNKSLGEGKAAQGLLTWQESGYKGNLGVHWREVQANATEGS